MNRFALGLALVTLVTQVALGGCRGKERSGPAPTACHDVAELVCAVCGESSRRCEDETRSAGYTSASDEADVELCRLTVEYAEGIRNANANVDATTVARIDGYFCAALTDDWRSIHSDLELTVIDSGGVVRLVDVHEGADLAVSPAPRHADVVRDPTAHFEPGDRYFAVELAFDNTTGFAPIDMAQFEYSFTCGTSHIESIMGIPTDAPLPRAGLVPVGETVSGMLLYEVEERCEASRARLTVYQKGIDRWLRTLGKKSPLDLPRDLRAGALPRFRTDEGTAAKSP